MCWINGVARAVKCLRVSKAAGKHTRCQECDNTMAIVGIMEVNVESVEENRLIKLRPEIQLDNIDILCIQEACVHWTWMRKINQES